MFITSGWAFSISSNKTTEYGFRRTFSVSCPASSYPTYPGGDPTIRETLCFSINSDISKRIKGSAWSKSSLDNTLTSSVFPTPVGPTKIKDAGRLREEICTRLRRTAAATKSTASSWPIIFSFRASSKWATRRSSVSRIFAAGIPVHSSTTRAKSSAVTGWFKALPSNSFNCSS